MTERSRTERGGLVRRVRIALGALAVLTALAALARAGIARAADGDLTNDFYVGGSIGSARVNYDPSTFGVGSSGTGYEVAVGFKPTQIVAAELDYVGFPRAFQGINYADTYGVGLDGLVFIPIPVVQVFGKVGALDWHTDAHSPLLSFTRTGTDLDYGGGVGSSWGNIGARIQFERFDVAHANRMQLTSIGLTWRF